MAGHRVAINGFGRVGRHFLRAAIARESPIEVVALNDLNSAAVLAHLLQYDTVHGKLDAPVELDGSAIRVGGRQLAVMHKAEPATLPWSELGIDTVVECTGAFTERSRAAHHLIAGADRVIVSAPTDAADVTVCVGVNDRDALTQRHRVVSSASCTTNCVAVLASVLNDAFGIDSAWATTVHAYTNRQQSVDAPDHDLRMARAAAHNIVPTHTGADRVVEQVIPSLAGRFDSVAVRVPVPDGSLTDLTCLLRAAPSAAEVNAAFAAAAERGPLAGILKYTDAPLVSSDVIGDPHSCVMTGADTKTRGREVKVFGWYDNEWGYANRLLDLVELYAGVERSRPVRGVGAAV